MSDLSGKCPVCGNALNLADTTVVSEVISCPDCQNRLVADKINAGKITLSSAPEVEEDWGE